MTTATAAWIVAFIITLAIWVPYMRHTPSDPDYNHGVDVEGLVKGLCSVMATLVLWLIFFAVMYFVS